MRFAYKTRNTCSSMIEFDLDGDIVTDIKFTSGCDGNLRAIGKILDGWTVDEIIDKCKGNLCGQRQTSCVDQLANAVELAQKKLSEQNTSLVE